jgi:hypothetical protein
MSLSLLISHLVSIASVFSLFFLFFFYFKMWMTLIYLFSF